MHTDVVEQEQKENQLVLRLIGYSFGFHLLVFLSFQFGYFDFERDLKISNEFSIEADLVIDTPKVSKKDSIAKSKKNKELKVNKKILPQLPKNIAIKNNSIKAPKDAMAELNEKKTSKVKANSKNSLLDRLRQKKEKKLVELEKKDALKRLLKEKARKQKKFADRNESPVDKTLLERREQLNASSKISVGKSFSSYVGKIKVWVHRKFVLPEVYRNKKIKKAVVEIVLDYKGGVKKLTLSRSSKNVAFDQYALKILKDASPFPKPPRELVGVPITYQFDPSHM